MSDDIHKNGTPKSDADAINYIVGNKEAIAVHEPSDVVKKAAVEGNIFRFAIVDG